MYYFFFSSLFTVFCIFIGLIIISFLADSVNITLLDAAAAKSLQSCPTLCDPIDGIPAGSPVPGILQAGTLEWVAISFSDAWKWKVKVKSLSRARLLATPWTAAHQASPSMGFSRQECWSGVPLPSPTLLDRKFFNSINIIKLYFRTLSITWGLIVLMLAFRIC